MRAVHISSLIIMLYFIVELYGTVGAMERANTLMYNNVNRARETLKACEKGTLQEYREKNREALFRKLGNK